MVMHENLLALSTAAMSEPRPRKYLSAEHAVGEYVRLKTLIEACPALDYERIGMMVQSQAAPENPHLDKLSEIWFLEDVFTEAHELAGETRWKHWVKVRVYGEILRGFRGVSKTTVKRNVKRVDGLVEEELALHNRIVQSQVRGAVA